MSAMYEFEDQTSQFFTKINIMTINIVTFLKITHGNYLTIYD